MFYLITKCSLLWLLQINNIDQVFQGDWLNMDFIDDFQVKIEGEGSFYTYDSTVLSKRAYIFAVDPHKVAFIQKNGNFKNFAHIKRIVNPNGYIDHYASGVYKINLNVKVCKLISEYRTELKGTLSITDGKNTRVIPVHGYNDEFLLNRKFRNKK